MLVYCSARKWLPTQWVHQWELPMVSDKKVRCNNVNIQSKQNTMGAQIILLPSDWCLGFDWEQLLDGRMGEQSLEPQ